MQGQVKWFDAQKSYGFIIGEDDLCKPYEGRFW